MHSSEQHAPTPAPRSATPVLDAIDQFRAPWAAGVAGLIFAILFTASIVLVRSAQLASMTQDQLDGWFAAGSDSAVFIAAVYLAPFAGIAFLWFIAVVRDQLRDREGPFFGTVFLGSGLVFVGAFFASVADLASMEVAVRVLGQPTPTVAQLSEVQAMAYTLLFIFSTRAAALFVMSTATVGLRTGAFPRWFAALGYVIGIGMLLFVGFYDWFVLLLPAWVAVVSLFILRRERDRRGKAPYSSKAHDAGARAHQ